MRVNMESDIIEEENSALGSKSNNKRNHLAQAVEIIQESDIKAN